LRLGCSVFICGFVYIFAAAPVDSF